MNNQKENPNQILDSKELIKPRKVEDIYANTESVEAFCKEFGSGTDCRGINNSFDPDEDSLLF